MADPGRQRGLAVQHAFAVLNGFIAIGFLGLIGIHILDAMQLRDQVVIEQEARFLIAAAITLGKLGLESC